MHLFFLEDPAGCRLDFAARGEGPSRIKNQIFDDIKFHRLFKIKAKIDFKML